ncbi:DNA polymerase III subunit delta [Gordonia asplenii]|uniref:DNA polymerase III subunit delta n=1 Tax=Gordonia asplenii TaxID=2725283 RepID=UPI001FE403CB|nr:DNA polymerase III subunit delta [Gordonia asplenii]
MHLLLGDDDFLAGRVVTEVAAQVSAEAGQQVPTTRVRAGDVTVPELAELLSPSLFAEERIIVVEAAAEAGKEPVSIITETAGQLPDGVTLLVMHSGGGRAKAMVPALKKVGAVEHDCVAPKWPEQKAKFVVAEFRNLGVKVSSPVAELIVQSVGGELRELAAACSQLVADTGGKVDAKAVTLYYSGRPEVTGFEIADQTVTGNLAGARESLAWAMHHGVPRVLLADALAEAVHGIARVRSIGNADPYSAASELGMPPTRVKKLQAQARAWDSESIARALVIVAALNGDVKGQAADADFALEHAVARIAGLRPERSRR